MLFELKAELVAVGTFEMLAWLFAGLRPEAPRELAICTLPTEYR